MLAGMDSPETPVAGSDAGLVARLKSGDDDAYEEIVRRYAGRLLAAVRRYLPAEEDARDAVQEAFLSAFRAIDRFEGGSRLYTWLYRIAINAALMQLRRKGSRPEEPIEDLLPRFASDGHREESGGGPWNRPDGASPDAAETTAIVRQAIARLPDAYRAVLLLRDIEGLDTEETARMLDTTPGAIKVRLHRARQALREILARSIPEGREA